ncbi:MAG: hypothetical protein ACFFAO_18815 [Candidatus Hermodarchaeota archaeon]
MSHDDLIDYIKQYQMRDYIDVEKADLEKNKILNIFINFLIYNQEFIQLLYEKRRKFNKFIIPLDEDLNLINFLNSLNELSSQSSFIEDLSHLLYKQFKNYLDKKKNLKNIFKLLNLAFQERFLERIDEYFYYCVNCHCYFITNKKFSKCICTEKLISFSFATIPDIIKKSIQNGHIVEHYTLNILKNNDIKLIGIEYNFNEIYTSIQYSKIGAGEKRNAEFDLIALKDNLILFIECKFNQTKYREIKDFLEATENFMTRIKIKFKQYNMRRLIITQDKSKLEVPLEINDLIIIELKDNLSKVLQNL